MSTQRKTGTLPSGTRFQSVASANAGSSAFLCACNHAISNSQVIDLLENNLSGTCAFCKMTIRPNFVRYSSVMVEPGSAELINDDVVLNTKWYHSTNSENWMDDLLIDTEGFNDGLIPLVHVGTLNAAMERSVDVGRKYLYTLELTDDATLSSEIVADQNDWPEWAWTAAIKFNVQRYINRWESPGSISLLVDPRKLCIVKREEIVGGLVKKDKSAKTTSQHEMAMKAYHAKNKQAA